MMTMAEPRNSALAITSSWRWPTEKLLPPSRTGSNSEPTIVVDMDVRLIDDVDGPPILNMPTRTSASVSSESLNSRNGSRLDLMVPENSTGSCGMTAMLERSLARPNVLLSTPSMEIFPASNSTMRRMESINVDFPAPVRPTTPTLLFAGMFKLRPFRTSGNPGRYRSCAFSKMSSPPRGHSFSTELSASVLRAASHSSPQYSFTRSTATMQASKSLAMRTLQFIDCVTDKANEMASPTNPAKASSPPLELCSNTPHRHAAVTMMVPTSSSRMANQHCAVHVKK
mmetsp:Transcript_23427/g.65389  ORF Transcript_23427/g.65389 Transcript_23427/m.65389 type:complete len:284 (+) Transcript_23427:329-1180(+)